VLHPTHIVAVACAGRQDLAVLKGATMRAEFQRDNRPALQFNALMLWPVIPLYEITSITIRSETGVASEGALTTKTPLQMVVTLRIGVRCLSAPIM
jgi:hypothetical protein